MTKSTTLTSLFDQLPPSRRSPLSLVLSVAFHGCWVAALVLGLSRLPRINDTAVHRHLEARIVSQDAIEFPRQRATGGGGAHATVHAHSPSHDSAPSHPAPPQPPTPPDLQAVLARANRTLIQPDVPPELKLLQAVPIPAVVKWSPVNTLNRLIVAPPPRPPTASLAKPTIKPPNHEVAPAAINIASSAMAKRSMPILPSTTSPIVVRRPEPVTHVPETASKTVMPSAPAQIVSLSDQPSKPVAQIPPANSVARSAPSGSLSSGQAENAKQAADASPSAKPRDNGIGTGSGDKAEKAGQGSGDKAEKAGEGTGNRADKATPGSGDKGDKSTSGNGASTQMAGNNSSGPATTNGNGSGGDIGGPVTRLSLPKDGQYGVVVVGSTLGDQYPETVEIWGSRLIYTVYLHVGAGKNWILQYSLPREAAQASSAVTKPDAPWPYDIVRPKLDPDDYNSDAIMVHGFVNNSGRFERLAIVYPTEFPKTKFVLNALQQWQFRPARQNGQVAFVEVLLIIPEENE